MKIGVILATEEEFTSFVNEYKNEYEIKAIKDFPFEAISFTYKNHDIYVVYSNIGIINSTLASQCLIDRCNIDLILNVGACGGLKENIKKNEIFIVENVVYYDFDLSLIDNVKKAQYPGFNSEFIPLPNKYLSLIENNLSLKRMNCASGDKFISDKELITHLVNDFNCSICDMEIIGETLAAYKNKIDIISLKVVSDNASSSEYESNALSSNEKLMKETRKIFDLL